MTRYLSSIWASVHGPADPRRLLLWLLNQRFAGLACSPGPRPLDSRVLRAAAADLPVAFPAVRCGSVLAETPPTAGMTASKGGERDLAHAAIVAAVRDAAALGCQLVVLEPGWVPLLGEVECDDLGDPSYRWDEARAKALLARRSTGRNAAVERACRGLFEVLRAFPDMRFALTAGRSLRAVADLEALADIFADLHHPHLGYWHDAAVIARREQVLGEASGQWLEAFGSRLRGATVADASPDGMYLPPGAGAADLAMLATYLPQQGDEVPLVLELDPAVPAAEMPGLLAYLSKCGL